MARSKKKSADKYEYPTDPPKKKKPKPFSTNAPDRRPLCFADLAKAHPGKGRPDDNGMIFGGRFGPWPDPMDDPMPPWDATEAERGFATPEARSARPFDRPPFGLGANGPSFSVDRFAQEMRDRLDGNCVGWAFVISRDGQEAAADADGAAITPGDLDSGGTAIGTRDFTPDTRINVASVSKTITAVAILRLLKATGRGITARIWPYLPAGWTLGPNVRDLQFRHLLTHQSGLTSTNSNFSQTLSDQGLRTAIATGANPGTSDPYLNANFALFRVILPALWAEAGHPAANNANPVASAFFYAVYIIEEVFGQMGGAIGDNASTSPLDAVPTRYYPTPTAFQGFDYPNWALIAGGGGWHLTARELAAFLALITYDDDVLAPDLRAAMDLFRLGWRPFGTYDGAFGDYLGHGGRIGSSTTPVGEVRTGIMKFNLQVEASLVVNSPIGATDLNATAVLRQAYDAAWA